MIRALAFSTNRAQPDSKEIAVADVVKILAEPDKFVWIDLDHPTPEETKSVLEDTFHFHTLSIEDCVAVSALPKVEEYHAGSDDKFAPYLFLILHAVDYNRKDGVFATSDLDFFLGKNFLVTYHDVPLRTIGMVADRCQRGARDLTRGPDRLTYALLDTLVQNYQPALDELSLEISEMEAQVLQEPTPELLKKLIGIKKEVLHLRRIIGPQRDVLGRLAGGEFELIRQQLVHYYRDVYDRLANISQTAQVYADSLTGILQIYLSMSSNQTGDVVKFLTLITALTTPLMIVGTWYGMNFKNMPELEWSHGYEYAIALMVVSTAATWWYFKKRNWF